MDFGFDKTDYWIYQGKPYEPSDSIWRLPRTGGNATKVWTFADRGAELGTGVGSIAADESCVYYSIHAKDSEELAVHARAKPE